MQRIFQQATILVTAFFWAVAAQAAPELDKVTGNIEVIISVADQRMAVLCDGELVVRYPISTSRYGVGDSLGSYRTPLGRLKVCDKIGDSLPAGAVIHHRAATGEVLSVNAPGRDPIVSRILWLEGLEDENRNAKARSIYIHGTPEERDLGRPMSWGCIRMRSKDVIDLYDVLPIGAQVTVLAEKMPHYPKYAPPPPPAPTPPPPELIASRAPASHAPQPAAPTKSVAQAHAPATPTPVANKTAVMAANHLVASTAPSPAPSRGFHFPFSALFAPSGSSPAAPGRAPAPAPIAALGDVAGDNTPSLRELLQPNSRDSVRLVSVKRTGAFDGSILYAGLAAQNGPSAAVTPPAVGPFDERPLSLLLPVTSLTTESPAQFTEMPLDLVIDASMLVDEGLRFREPLIEAQGVVLGKVTSSNSARRD